MSCLIPINVCCVTQKQSKLQNTLITKQREKEVQSADLRNVSPILKLVLKCNLYYVSWRAEFIVWWRCCSSGCRCGLVCKYRGNTVKENTHNSKCSPDTAAWQRLQKAAATHTHTHTLCNLMVCDVRHRHAGAATHTRCFIVYLMLGLHTYS